MARLEAFGVAGLELFFNSLDHLPPHFHARRPGEWEIRVYFLVSVERLEFDVKWALKKRMVSARERAALLAGINAFRPAVSREWEAKVCSSGPARGE